MSTLVNGPVVAFVATKPLQILTSIIVARQLSLHRARLVVVPNFAGADGAVARLSRHETGFERVGSAPNRFAAILSLGAEDVERVFVDSDVGLKTPIAMGLLRLLRPRVRFSLYEEGVSLIEPEPADRPHPLYVRLGAVKDLGESRSVDEVWTYTPDAVRVRLPSKALHRIDAALGDFVRAERQLLHAVFWDGFEFDTYGWGGTLCRIYLSSWRVDHDAMAYLTRSHGYRIFKPHPHIRHDVALPYQLDQVLAASIPAELVIVALAKVFATVEVMHHGSSVATYVQAPNVRYIRVEEAIAPEATCALEHA